MLRVALLIAALLSVLVVSPTSAQLRADPAAPPGASADWLPSEEWVMERWLPFDQTDLLAMLGLDAPALWKLIGRTGRSIDGVAAARGVPRHRLAHRLVNARSSQFDATPRHVLITRANRVLSQPHLAEHVLFHPFHTWSVLRNTREVFGVPQAAFDDLLQRRHLSFIEIASTAGIDRAELRRRALRHAAHGARKGMREGAITPTQAKAMRRLDIASFDQWSQYRLERSRTRARSAVRRSSFLCPLAEPY